MERKAPRSFVVADKVLGEVAALEGLLVLNPEAA